MKVTLIICRRLLTENPEHQTAEAEAYYQRADCLIETGYLQGHGRDVLDTSPIRDLEAGLARRKKG